MTVSAPLREVYADGVFPTACPSRILLDHVMSKWGFLVLLALSEGEPLRWSELRRRAQGVSEKMLAQTLRILVSDGLVERHARPVVPPHVEYTLTPAGEQLAEHLVPLMRWIVEHASAAELELSEEKTGAGRPERALPIVES